MTTSVSAVVPCHQGGPFLRQAVASMLAQTRPPDEITVVSDGCPDDLSDLEATDARVRVIRQANAGVSVARNTGVAASTGDLVAFLDEDDLCEPRRLELQVAGLRADPDAGVCHGRWLCIDRAGEVVGRPLGQPAEPHDVLALVFPRLSTFLVRRSVLARAGGFDPTLAVGEDIDVYLRLAMLAGTVFVPEILVRYRLHQGNTPVPPWSARPVLQRHRDWAEATGRDDLVAAADLGLRRLRRGAARQAFDQGRAARRRQDPIGTARYLAVSFAREPGFLPGVAWAKLTGRPDHSPEARYPG